ncbi:uncharacterized protein LOC123329958 [Bubalus bubalis]|uniref:uncharacterized protein LOC123329958 n=1 Tax=Bubalus bubalis TaxID=89462 RepID=UPI001D0F68A2|nr:uncharacterized protein LOC123329958 [Bubalus bubalis]
MNHQQAGRLSEQVASLSQPHTTKAVIEERVGPRPRGEPSEDWKPKPRAPAIASGTAGALPAARSQLRQSSEGSDPDAGPRPSLNPQLTFLCAPESPKTAPAQGPASPNLIPAGPRRPSRTAQHLRRPFPRSLPRQRAGDGAPRGPSLLQRLYSACRERKDVCVFLWCPLVVGGSSIADIARLRKRIHSLHQIQDGGYLREAGWQSAASHVHRENSERRPLAGSEAGAWIRVVAWTLLFHHSGWFPSHGGISKDRRHHAHTEPFLENRWDKLKLREGKCGQLRNGPQKDQVLSPEPVSVT